MRDFYIVLPWPPSTLSGHAKGTWWNSSPVVKKHRAWAFNAAKAARLFVPPSGDIPLHIEFYPPDNRSDRCNYWNRCKAYIDGIAEALGVNDRRFLPSMSFHENIPGGKILVLVGERLDQ